MLNRLLMVAGGAAGFAPSGGLMPTSSLSVTRSGSNPTFNFNSLVENVIKVGSTYWCVYQPQPNDIRLASASSPAGPWTAYAGNPVITGIGRLYAPHFYVEGGTYHILYSVIPGTSSVAGIAYATASSVTGPYTKQGYILNPGTAGAWDDYRVGEPSVWKDGSTYWMAYMGERSPLGSSEQVGVASASSIGGPWTRSPSNPVLVPSVSGWDEDITADPEIFVHNGFWWIWYTGQPPQYQAGLAYANAPEGPWTKHADNPIIGGSGSGFDQNGAFRGAIFIEGGVYHITYTGIPSGALNLSTMKGGNAVLDIS